MWIILLLLFCGGCGSNNNGCGNLLGGSDNGCCSWIIWILLISCFCGNNNSCC